MKKRILVNEDFNEDVVKSYIENGFEIHVRSKRKIQLKDKKTYNKLKKVRLSESNLKFGSIKDLNDKYNYDVVHTGDDPVLEKLMVLGKEVKGRIIKSEVVNSMESAISLSESLMKDVDMRFISVKTYFTYGEIPGIPPAKTGSRDFCSRLMTTPNKMWSLTDIMSLSNGMKDVSDPFQFRGGYYQNPITGEVTPYCRHQWNINVVIED